MAIAPSTAMPTALPTLRANRLVPVTTPRSCHGTLDWAATSEGDVAKPSPSPMTKHTTAIRTTEGVGAISTSATVLRMTMEIPISTVERNPMRM